MRRTLGIIIILLLPLYIHAQVITTIGGNGTPGNIGDGSPATSAEINYPIGGAVDQYGNYYFTTGDVGNTIRKISSSGIISTVAGTTGMSGFGGDGGLATNAMLNNPQYVTVDATGNIYISDAANNRVRKVNVTTGIISTIAGTGSESYGGDLGPATTAMIYQPIGLCFDKSGNLYIADVGNSKVRKISTSGIITTVAGNEISGYGANNIAATSVSISVYGLCVDNAGNLYIADGVRRVYKVNMEGIITYFAGNGTSGFSGDGGPATDAETLPFEIAIDKFNNIYICEYQQNRIRLVNSSNGTINTIVGNGVAGYNGEGVNANAAQVNYPSGIALDSCGNLYIPEAYGFRVSKVTYPKCGYLDVANETISHEKEFIYPNPTYDILNINNLKTPATYILQSIVGATIQQGTLKEGNNSINIQAVPNGMYMLVIMDNENGKRIVNKIIKQ